MSTSTTRTPEAAAQQRPAALVTGGSRGIGLGIARALAHAGYDLTLTARGAERLAEVAGELGAAGVRVLTRAGDAADEEATRQVARAHAEAYGRLDVLVLAAGVGTAGGVDRLSMRRFDKQLAVNLRSPFVLLQETLPLLRATAAGNPARGAKVIALSSFAGVLAEPGLSAYGASKAALVSLCRSVNTEEVGNGVSATALCPGYVDTDMAAWKHDRIAPQEMIRVEDIAELALSLTRLSPHAVVPEIVVTRPGEYPAPGA